MGVRISPEHTPQQLAALLYDSLHGKLLKLPDSVEVYPAHGAGSLCGRNISPERRSTIGKERAFNYALRPMSRQDFVSLMTADLPERPGYFARDAEINRAGAAALDELPALPALGPEEVERKMAQGAVVLDTRPAAQFGAGHLPGAVHIALSGQYASWAATLLGLDRAIVLVAEDPERLAESRMRLTRVGIENVAGFLDGGVLAWEHSGRPLDAVPQISVLDLYQQLYDDPRALQVVDVRKLMEWEAGHIVQAVLTPLNSLALDSATALSAFNGAQDAGASLNREKPIAIHCKSGYRSSMATSLFQRAGFRQVMNVVGGFDAWQAQKLPAALAKTASGTTKAAT